MTPVIDKVFAYITHQNRLLIFRHTDFPEAGFQVPAGTVMANENYATAVLREAREETGLSHLTIQSYLGEQIRNMQDVGKDEVHQRHFFTCSAAVIRQIIGSMMKPAPATAV